MSGIRLIVGFSRGSASDEIARALVPQLSRELGQSVDIELRPGNNGAPAAQEVAKAAADGRTLFMATLGTHALAPHLSDHLPYDPLLDFAPVSLIATAPLVLACHPSLRVSNARELIEQARERPRSLTYASSAIGGAPHLAAELFQSISGIEMQHVRYERTEQLYEDLETGRISLSFNNIMSMLPRCRAGKLTAIGVTSAQRTAAAPTLSTIAESALPGYEVSNWLGIVAPKGTPRLILNDLRAATASTLRSSDVEHAFLAAGVTPATAPIEFADFIAAEMRRWAPVVNRFRDTGVADSVR
ncbi:MAG: putative tricarboxylic transport rane protein [Betaproteobacteria bacterium]